MKVQVFMLKQDDPAKCTAAKLIKFGLATQVRKIIHATVVLHPFAEKTVLKKDRDLVDSITAVDCSWELAQKVFARNFLGFSRKLPPLLAGNPVNYAKIGKLTTAESIAATLFIMGLDDQAHNILNKFKWGHTFFELNRDLLKDYSSAE
ncbi:MAG: DUF367 family protein, partial [Patescibacteria group bacterium]|nr:DUF367 family protein [Patescibacteria group bacterium]